MSGTRVVFAWDYVSVVPPDNRLQFSRTFPMNPFLPVSLVAVATFLLVGLPGGAAITAEVAVRGHRRGGGSRGAHVAPDTPLLSEALAHSPDLLAPPSTPMPNLQLAAWPAPTDEDRRIEVLVGLAQDGDAEAFGELFEHFQGPIYRQLFFLTRSVPVAEDLTSETFFRALRAMRRSQVPGSYFGPWLRKIARNLAVDHATARSTRTETVVGDSFGWLDIGALDADLDATIERDSVRTALRRLPENQRRVLAMRFLCQLSVEETAQEMGCTPGAAKQLQWRGLRNLERIIVEQSGD